MSETLKLLQDQLVGLRAREEALRGAEKLFIKAQALYESIERARAEVDTNQLKLDEEKERLADLQATKTEAIRGTAEALSAAMNLMIPGGNAAAGINDSGVFFVGFVSDSDAGARSYNALSGGERAMINAALQNALVKTGRNAIVVLEAGEVDAENLAALVEKIESENPEAQLIINSWHKPASVPEGWEVHEL